MDIRYCDRCGEMLGSESAEKESASEILCGRCMGNIMDNTVLNGDPMMTEEITPPGDMDPLNDFPDEDPKLTLSTVLQEQGLDLFSTDTLAIRKQSQKKATNFSIVDDDSDDDSEDDTKEHLFSLMGHAAPATAGPKKAPSVTQRRSASVAKAPANPAGRGDHDGAPVAAAARWRISCVHCNAKLKIPAVRQRSKLSCPRCQNLVIVEPDGTLRAPNPGSITVTKAEQAIAQLAEGSSFVARTPRRAPAPPTAPPRKPMTPPATPRAPLATRPATPTAPPPPAAPPTTPAAPKLTFAPAPPNRPAGTKPGGPTVDEMVQRLKPKVTPPPAPSTAKEEVAAALLNRPPTPAPARPATRPRPATAAPTGRRQATVPAETAVLWFIVASIPSFVGLIVASDLTSDDSRRVIAEIGKSLKACFQAIFSVFGG